MRKTICLLLALCFISAFTWAEGNELDYTSDFTDGTDGWFGRGAQIEAIDGALLVSGRTSSWNSPGRYFELVPGSKYEISVDVMQDSLDSAELMISVAHTKDRRETYENLVRGKVVKGEWISLNCTYTFGDFDQYILYVETVGNGELSFAIRNFHVKGEALSYDMTLPRLAEKYSPYFDFGCAVTQLEALNTVRRDFYVSQFNIFTCGNELKPDYVIDLPASAEKAKADDTAVAVKFDSAKPMLDYCFTHGLKVHGHVLVWHSQTPEAFFHEGYDTAKPFVSREVMLARLDNYIRLIMEYTSETYPGLIVSWDVANEVIDDSTGKLRVSNWTRVVGDDFVERAFEITRKYAPEGTLLFYNDYSTPYEPKLSGILALLDRLIAEGKIDGYGFQCHYEMTTPSITAVHNALQKVADRGLLIRISELDIKVSALNDSAFTMQAGRYEALMKEFLSFSDSIIAVHTWGVSDDLSWLSNKYPLLFDKSLSPKPAFYSLIDLVS
ncbi:MAG: endo-1,4-beta-xylanase [Clostridia bacterium]|nr:endo-1,4-beta-xylanase [Clostridia bacterium]